MAFDGIIHPTCHSMGHDNLRIFFRFHCNAAEAKLRRSLIIVLYLMHGCMKRHIPVDGTDLSYQAVAHCLLAEPIRLDKKVPGTDSQWAELMGEGLIHVVVAVSLRTCNPFHAFADLLHSRIHRMRDLLWLLHVQLFTLAG